MDAKKSAAMKEIYKILGADTPAKKAEVKDTVEKIGANYLQSVDVYNKLYSSGDILVAAIERQIEAVTEWVKIAEDCGADPELIRQQKIICDTISEFIPFIPRRPQ